MSAYIAFYEDRQCIVQSLIEGCSDSKIAETVFDVLVKGELFLDLLFYCYPEAYNFDKIYDSAIEIAKQLEAKEFYCRLLFSKAFSEAYHGATGYTMQLLSKARKLKRRRRRHLLLRYLTQKKERACATLASASLLTGKSRTEFSAYKGLFC